MSKGQAIYNKLTDLRLMINDFRFYKLKLNKRTLIKLVFIKVRL